jgi:4-hydroxy-2-oxoheptanedioate aldolase
MRPNTLKALAQEGRVAVNAWVSMGSGYLAEILGHAGFDAVTIDLQHGAYGFDTAVQLLHAVSSTPAIPLARSAGASLAEINKLLDAGAYGVICPLIETVDEAVAFARACRYPPRGVRSYGPARGLTYGGMDYPQHADDHVLSLAMIETLPALAAIERILDVDELDGIYMGPSDLGLAMGIGPNAWPGKEMADAVAHVLEATQRRGKYAGIFASSVEMSQAMSGMGYHLVTPGNDAQLLRSAAAGRIEGVRSAAPRSKNGT